MLQRKKVQQLVLTLLLTLLLESLIRVCLNRTYPDLSLSKLKRSSLT